MIRVLLLAALLLPAAASAQSYEDMSDPTADISSHRDYTDPAQRDRPIACKDGDLARHPGETLGQLFGDAWPATPVAAQREPAAVAHWANKPVMPAGLAPKDVLVVVATLVDETGKPLRAEPICSTSAGFDAAAARTVLASRFAPARFDGVAKTSADVVVVKYFRGGVMPLTRRRP
ncbi:energy transducer TonB [Lysobacter claricitrinus]|uniref:energy transducer TonB n=1 Tax=Lysobacter claricitrinus TaxID=3367728 RepID=UPI0037DAB015